MCIHGICEVSTLVIHDTTHWAEREIVLGNKLKYIITLMIVHLAEFRMKYIILFVSLVFELTLQIGCQGEDTCLNAIHYLYVQSLIATQGTYNIPTIKKIHN